jgi:hypothetical protein
MYPANWCLETQCGSQSRAWYHFSLSQQLRLSEIKTITLGGRTDELGIVSMERAAARQNKLNSWSKRSKKKSCAATGFPAEVVISDMASLPLVWSKELRKSSLYILNGLDFHTFS